jgi:LPS sulfotransferase NodH
MQWFVVIGARRTGTNILREVLNSNPHIAMLGEVFTPSPAPAHWENFLAVRPDCRFPPSDSTEAVSLMDEYFKYVESRIRNHWDRNVKAASRALGFDVKYDQLWQVSAGGPVRADAPFLLDYLKRNRILLIHTVRKNVIKCSISEIIAQQRNLWHNYGATRIDRSYAIDPGDCLGRARLIVRSQHEFETWSRGCRVIKAEYEDLAGAIARARDGQIAEDALPFKDIAQSLRVTASFSYDGRLRRAIDVPYSRLVSTFAELRRAVADSEFSQFASSLE